MEDKVSIQTEFNKDSQKNQSQIIHIQIFVLGDYQLDELMIKLKGHENQQNLKISFLKSESQIQKNQITLFSDILQSIIKIQELQINNKSPEGDNSNLIYFLKHVQAQNIQTLNLKIKQNDLRQNESEELSQILLNYQYLKELNLKFIQHSDDSYCLNSLVDLAKCTQLQILKVSLLNTKINSQKLNVLLHSVCKITQLRQLELLLSEDKLNSQDLIKFKQIPINLTSLKILSIRIDYQQKLENQLSDYDMFNQKDDEQLISSNQLEQLCLQEQSTHIEDKKVQSQLGFLFLRSYTSISKLSLFLEGFEGTDLIQYSKFISKLGQLQELSLSLDNTKFTQEITAQFGKVISNLISLKELNVKLRYTAYFQNVYIQDMIKNCKQIHKLKLCFKQLVVNFQVQDNIYEVFPHLDSLKQLTLKFSSGIQQQFQFLTFGNCIKRCKNLNIITIEFKQSSKEVINKLQIILNEEPQVQVAKATKIQTAFRARQRQIENLKIKQLQTQINNTNIRKTPKLVAIKMNE